MLLKLTKIFELKNKGTLSVEIKLALAHYVEKSVKRWTRKSKKTYFLIHNAGFFSCASMALQEVIDRNYTKINARFGMRLYKRFLFSDPWMCYFSGVSNLKIDNAIQFLAISGQLPRTEWWQENYSLLPSKQTKAIIKKYFTPSKRVLHRKKELILQHKIITSKTIGVHFRGTDKSQELPLTPIQRYSDILDILIRENPTYKILIQTDDLVAEEFLAAKFNEKTIMFSGLKTNKGRVSMHYLSARRPVKPTIDYFARVLILSECAHLVTHTGNGALWEVLYRGNSKNVIQL